MGQDPDDDKVKGRTTDEGDQGVVETGRRRCSSAPPIDQGADDLEDKDAIDEDKELLKDAVKGRTTDEGDEEVFLDQRRGEGPHLDSLQRIIHEGLLESEKGKDNDVLLAKQPVEGGVDGDLKKSLENGSSCHTLGRVFAIDSDHNIGAIARTGPEQDLKKEQGAASPRPRLSLNSVVEGALNQLEALPNPPRPQQPAQALPGAFPQAGLNRRESEVSVSMFTYYNTSNRRVEDVEQGGGGGRPQCAIHENDNSTTNEGLVEALPVEPLSLPTEQAEPMDEEELQQQEAQERKKRQDTQRRKNASMRYLLLGLAGLIMLVVGLVVWGTLGRGSSSTSDTPSESTNATTEAPRPPSELPILALLPNFTQWYIRREIKTSPQYQAYQWMKEDPNIWTPDYYSEERMIQRFVLATLYYAMDGENWNEKGGGLVQSRPPMGGTGGGGGGRPPPNGQGPPPQNGMGPPGGQQSGGAGPPQNGFGPPNGQAAGPPPQGQGGGPGQGGPSPQGQGGGPGQGGPPPQGQGGQRPPPGAAPQSVQSEQWLSYGTHECQWYTTSMTKPSQQMCSDNTTITEIDIMANNLVGTLPEELGLLTSLTKLSLRDNGIWGSLFTQIGRLTSLKHLLLQENELTGTIPSEIGLLSTSLHWFVILDNALSGTLPTQFWSLSQLTEFKVGKMDHDGLAFTIPDNIADLMPRLQKFMAAASQIKGTLPSGLGRCTDMNILDVTHNQLNGTLPSELGLWTNTERISISNNMIEGSIPSELASLTGLVGLWLANNEGLSGNFPSEFGNLSETLVDLRLVGTSISGMIPEALCNARRLEFECGLLCGCTCECYEGNRSLAEVFPTPYL